jgi:hypothetical protein
MTFLCCLTCTAAFRRTIHFLLYFAGRNFCDCIHAIFYIGTRRSTQALKRIAGFRRYRVPSVLRRSSRDRADSRSGSNVLANRFALDSIVRCLCTSSACGLGPRDSRDFGRCRRCRARTDSFCRFRGNPYRFRRCHCAHASGNRCDADLRPADCECAKVTIKRLGKRVVEFAGVSLKPNFNQGTNQT